MAKNKLYDIQYRNGRWKIWAASATPFDPWPFPKWRNPRNPLLIVPGMPVGPHRLGDVVDAAEHRGFGNVGAFKRQRPQAFQFFAQRGDQSEADWRAFQAGRMAGAGPEIPPGPPGGFNAPSGGKTPIVQPDLPVVSKPPSTGGVVPVNLGDGKPTPMVVDGDGTILGYYVSGGGGQFGGSFKMDFSPDVYPGDPRREEFIDKFLDKDDEVAQLIPRKSTCFEILDGTEVVTQDDSWRIVGMQPDKEDANAGFVDRLEITGPVNAKCFIVVNPANAPDITDSTPGSKTAPQATAGTLKCVTIKPNGSATEGVEQVDLLTSFGLSVADIYVTGSENGVKVSAGLHRDEDHFRRNGFMIL